MDPSGIICRSILLVTLGIKYVLHVEVFFYEFWYFCKLVVFIREYEGTNFLPDYHSEQKTKFRLFYLPVAEQDYKYVIVKRTSSIAVKT